MNAFLLFSHPALKSMLSPTNANGSSLLVLCFPVPHSHIGYHSYAVWFGGSLLASLVRSS